MDREGGCGGRGMTWAAQKGGGLGMWGMGMEWLMGRGWGGGRSEGGSGTGSRG